MEAGQRGNPRVVPFPNRPNMYCFSHACENRRVRLIVYQIMSTKGMVVDRVDEAAEAAVPALMDVEEAGADERGAGTPKNHH